MPVNDTLTDKDDDIHIVETLPGTEPNKKDEEQLEDKRSVRHEDDLPEDDETGTPEEREAIRERRRKEKQERKHRREEAIKRNNLEMDFLRKRNDDLERRLNGVEQNTVRQQVANVDSEIDKARREYTMAEEVIAKAVAAGNGEDVTKAMRFRDDAARRFNEYNDYKRRALEQAQAPRQEAVPKVDPVVLRHAQAFVEKNDWYDPRGGDEDSAIVLAIDNSLVKEGFDPTTKEYWSELEKRAARRLPEKFQDRESRQDKLRDTFGDDDDEPAVTRRPRGGPALGSGRESAPATTRREVYVSPERVQALKDAGVWEDPVLRKKYVLKYAEYDKANKKRG